MLRDRCCPQHSPRCMKVYAPKRLRQTRTNEFRTNFAPHLTVSFSFIRSEKPLVISHVRIEPSSSTFPRWRCLRLADFTRWEVASLGAKHSTPSAATPRSRAPTTTRRCRSCEWTLARSMHALGIASRSDRMTRNPLSPTPHSSCAKAGYFRDDFIAFFVKKSARRSPLINRGGYTLHARHACHAACVCACVYDRSSCHRSPSMRMLGHAIIVRARQCLLAHQMCRTRRACTASPRKRTRGCAQATPAYACELPCAPPHRYQQHCTPLGRPSACVRRLLCPLQRAAAAAARLPPHGRQGRAGVDVCQVQGVWGVHRF